MERGIGRTGYLLLAFVLFTVGAFGLLLAGIAFREAMPVFFYLGLGTTAAGLLALFVFASFRPLPGPARPTPAAEPPTTSATDARRDPADESFEYDRFEPAAPAAPEQLVLPDAFQDERPPGAEAPVSFRSAPRPEATANAAPARPKQAWPERRTPVAKPGQAPPEPERPTVRAELTERYTRDTPMVRQVLGTDAPSEHVAERAPKDMNTDFVPADMSVGRCGQCKALLLAPDERPIRLKCPDCARVTLLE